MEKKIITRGNNLIAEFMELQEGYPHETDHHGYDQCLPGYHIMYFINAEYHSADTSSHEFTVDQLKYHESWDWLVPVCSKMTSQNFDQWSSCSDFWDAYCQFDIAIVWSYVVAYISELNIHN